MGEISKREDERQRRVTAAAIRAARRVVVGDGAAIPMMTPIGRLSDVQWGWIVAAVIFGWIATRAEQAASEGLGAEHHIHAGLDPDPWDIGAMAVILPQLAKMPGIDWEMPLSNWPRESMMAFLAKAVALAGEAISARDRVWTITSRGTVKFSDVLPPV